MEGFYLIQANYEKFHCYRKENGLEIWKVCIEKNFRLPSDNFELIDHPSFSIKLLEFGPMKNFAATSSLKMQKYYLKDIFKITQKS